MVHCKTKFSKRNTIIWLTDLRCFDGLYFRIFYFVLMLYRHAFEYNQQFSIGLHWCAVCVHAIGSHYLYDKNYSMTSNAYGVHCPCVDFTIWDEMFLKLRFGISYQIRCRKDINWMLIPDGKSNPRSTKTKITPEFTTTSRLCCI